MGTLATRFFDQAEELAGLRGKIRLAVLSKTTSSEAASAADAPELLHRLETALQALRHEAANRELQRTELREPARRSGTPRPEVFAAAGEQTLRRYQRAFLELMTQRSLFLGDVSTTIRRITECASHTLEIDRVSVWYVDEQVTSITCADLYERAGGTHASGTVLHVRDFEPYFHALREERTIAAHEAHTDPRTSCFSASYLGPLGIEAMLDVPIWVSDRMVGVICHEHQHTKRTWTTDEETFAYLMSSFVALAMEQERVRARTARASLPAIG